MASEKGSADAFARRTAKQIGAMALIAKGLRDYGPVPLVDALLEVSTSALATARAEGDAETARTMRAITRAAYLATAGDTASERAIADIDASHDKPRTDATLASLRHTRDMWAREIARSICRGQLPPERATRAFTAFDHAATEATNAPITPPCAVDGCAVPGAYRVCDTNSCREHAQQVYAARVERKKEV